MYKYAMTKSCKTALLRKVPETARFHIFDILWKLTLRRLLLGDILWKQTSCRLPADDILWKCAALVPSRFSGSRKNDTSKKSPKRSKKDKNPVRTAMTKKLCDGVDLLFESIRALKALDII